MSLSLIYHPRFLEHRQADVWHPERPERLEAVIERLRAEELWRDVIVPEPAPWETLARAHDERYLARLRDFGEGRWDFDTYVRPDTFEIARLAAGGALLAAETTWRERRPALALLRPPGHHATPDRAMGFCYLNNVAIAALAHLAAGRGRVAIVDLDVHHGNGTQNIFYWRQDALYLSIHQWPLYPGTGLSVDLGEGAGKGFTINIPLPPASGNATYLDAFERIVEPVLAHFAPSLLLVSFGVDAHYMDPLAEMTLTTSGYVRLAERLRAAAERLCEGRLALMLEGGYHLDALAEVVAGVVAAFNGRATRVPPAYDAEQDPHALGRSTVDAIVARLAPHWPIG